MPHPKTLNPENCALLVVDVQEAFRSAVSDFPLIASRIAQAVSGFQILNLPIIITEQYPKGLGRTADEILYALPAEFEIIEKTTFSCFGTDEFSKKMRENDFSQIVLCGLETHVCVNQTAHDLLNENVQVHVLTDAVASRFENDKNAGIKKMLSSGVIPSSVEMALFELMGDSRHECFKEIQSIIK